MRILYIFLCTVVLLFACNKSQTSKAIILNRTLKNILNADKASTGGISFVDYDADGDPDMFVTNGYDVSQRPNPIPQKNRFYENHNGKFREIELPPLTLDSGYSSGSTWADFDNDGDLDVYVTNQMDQNNFLYVNDNGGFIKEVSSEVVHDSQRSFAASWVDINNDGFVDLYIGNGGLTARGADMIFQNNGDGTFTGITNEITSDSIASVGGVWGDIDNDNDMDLYIPDAFGKSQLYVNEGNWKFTRKSDLTEGPINYPSSGAVWVDIDNDLDLDLYVPNSYGFANFLYINDGLGNFSKESNDIIVTEGHGSGHCLFLDLDNDGDLDLVEGNWAGASALYKNDGKGNFERLYGTEVDSYISYASSMAAADIDGDGDLDFGIGNWPNFPGKDMEVNHVYRNNSEAKNWLKIKLKGTSSNRSAIGAKIIVTADIGGKDVAQLRFVSAQESWRSMSELTQHFGLGEANQVEKIQVFWPSGWIDVFENIGINNLIEITEEETKK